MAQPATGPLAGVTVLNCGTAGVGPWAATLLGFLGARVIKVERPGGDFIKLIYPRSNGTGAAYHAFNADQQVLELDLKQAGQLAQFDDLVRDADIFIENFRRGVAERLSMGEARVRGLNPAIIYGSSSAWGEQGPMRDFGAVDSHLQAFSGFASLNGEEGCDPEMLRSVHVDPNGSVHFAALLVLALLQRQRSGEGSAVRTSHFAMALAMMASRIAEKLHTPDILLPLGSAAAASAPNACWQCADGVWLAVAAQDQSSWQRLCAALDRPELGSDPRFLSNADRVTHRLQLGDILKAEFARFPARWWISRLERFQLPHSRILDFDDLRYHTQVDANGYLAEIASDGGPALVGGPPWAYSRTPARAGTRDTATLPASGPVMAKSPAGEGPLSACRVLDLSEGYAGPLAALWLAEAGAKVTKLETPQGDWSRQLVPREASSSALYQAFNRNKRGLIRDPESALDREEVAASLADSDLVIYDRGGRWAQSLGLGDRSIAEVYPALLCVEFSAHGPEGPLADVPGSELVLQAMTGYLKNLGQPGGPPVRVGADIAECGTAAMGFLGALAGWYERQLSGQGQRVACSMLGTLMAMRSMRWASLDAPDEWRGPDCTSTTSGPLRGYHASDGLIWPSLRTIRDEKVLDAILDQLGLPQALRDDPLFMEHIRDTLGLGYLSGDWRAQWNRVLRDYPRQALLDIFRQANGIAVEFMRLDEVLRHPQTLSLNIINESSAGRACLRAPWTQVPWAQPELSPAPSLLEAAAPATGRLNYEAI